ncbi:hypothetical protein TNCV_1959251 [Trichonephila clavipes]|nr:hypothetical protein TNCV_1959251 [Trichonephila clavipes]
MAHFWISPRVLVLEFSVTFSFYSHVDSHTDDDISHYDDEIEAIHLAVHRPSSRLSTPDKAVILSGSDSAIQALASNQDKSVRVQDCRELLRGIPTKVVFQCVPCHCALWGNKMGNRLAKRGTDILQKSTADL